MKLAFSDHREHQGTFSETPASKCGVVARSDRKIEDFTALLVQKVFSRGGRVGGCRLVAPTSDHLKAVVWAFSGLLTPPEVQKWISGGRSPILEQFWKIEFRPFFGRFSNLRHHQVPPRPFLGVSSGVCAF